MAFVQILGVVTCLICATCVLSQDTQSFKVNTDGCSVTKTCNFFPSSCPEGDSNCEANRRIITWKKAAASSSTTGPLIEIEMRSSPGAGYIAIGFGRYNIMKDADVYYCTSSNTFHTAAITVSHQAPSKSNLLPSTKSTANSKVENSINCRFQRPMAVSKPSTTGEYSYDLSKESFYILAAEGPTNPEDQTVGYHNWREVTNDKINFIADFPVDTPSPVTTPSTNATDTLSPVTTPTNATSPDDPTKKSESSQTTNKDKPATNQQRTTPPAAPPQTTSKALSIQVSFCMSWIILISTVLFIWKC